MIAAVGMNTIRLDLPPGQQSAKFRLLYPTQPNKLDYTVGDASTVAVVGDEDLRRDGIITSENAVLALQSDSYDPAHPVAAEFEIKKSGYYHVLFGPGKNTSILVLEPALTVKVEPVTPGARVGDFIAPATAGDFHLVKHPALGMRQFAGWFAVFFDEYRAKYEQLGLATAHSLSLEGKRAVRFARAISKMGYPGFDGVTASMPKATGPFLGHVNGLAVEAVDSAYLVPGEYEFVYRPRSVASSIVRTNEIVLRLYKDSALDDGFGTEAEVMARVAVPASNGEFRLPFKVTEPAYYHLSYGPGEGGLIFHLVPDEEIPTQIVVKKGEVRNHARLTGINSVIIGPRPLDLGGMWEVFFPCKVVRERADPLKLYRNVQIPLTTDVALSVARLGAAIMHPIMIERMKDELALRNGRGSSATTIGSR